jgi:hypothetical protein
MHSGGFLCVNIILRETHRPKTYERWCFICLIPRGIKIGNKNRASIREHLYTELCVIFSEYADTFWMHLNNKYQISIPKGVLKVCINACGSAFTGSAHIICGQH